MSGDLPTTHLFLPGSGLVKRIEDIRAEQTNEPPAEPTAIKAAIAQARARLRKANP